jgi:hypothetical protein
MTEANYMTTEPEKKKLSEAKQRKMKRWFKKTDSPKLPLDTKDMRKDRKIRATTARKIKNLQHKGDWPGTPHPEITTAFCPVCRNDRTYINGEFATCRKKKT